VLVVGVTSRLVGLGNIIDGMVAVLIIVTTSLIPDPPLSFCVTQTDNNSTNTNNDTINDISCIPAFLTFLINAR